MSWRGSVDRSDVVQRCFSVRSNAVVWRSKWDFHLPPECLCPVGQESRHSVRVSTDAMPGKCQRRSPLKSAMSERGEAKLDEEPPFWFHLSNRCILHWAIAICQWTKRNAHFLLFLPLFSDVIDAAFGISVLFEVNAPSTSAPTTNSNNSSVHGSLIALRLICVSHSCQVWLSRSRSNQCSSSSWRVSSLFLSLPLCTTRESESMLWHFRRWILKEWQIYITFYPAFFFRRFSTGKMSLMEESSGVEREDPRREHNNKRYPSITIDWQVIIESSINKKNAIHVNRSVFVTSEASPQSATLVDSTMDINGKHSKSTNNSTRLFSSSARKQF